MNKNRNVFIIPLAFLIAVLFYYPFQWIRVFTRVSCFSFTQLATVAVLSVLALAFIFLSIRRLAKLFNKQNILPLSLLGIIAGVCVIQGFFFDNFGPEYIAGGLFYPSLVLFGVLYRRQLLYLLLKFAAFLWVADIICATFRNDILMFGLPANRNWHATLIIITLPAFIYECERLLKKIHWQPAFIRVFIYVPAILFSCHIVYVCESKGAYLAMAGAAALTIVFGSRKLLNPSVRPLLKTGLLAVALVCAITLAILAHTHRFDSVLEENVRYWFWKGTVKMIGDHPLLGGGGGLYESGFSSYLPPEYYLNKNATDRNNHPHNHFLYIGASFGLIFFLCWAFIIFYSVLQNLLDLSDRSTGRKILFFMFVCLLLHAQVDLVAYQWPTNSMFLLLLGTLWGYTWHRKCRRKIPAPLPVLATVCGLFLAGCAVFFAQREFRSGFYYRAARIANLQGNAKLALACADRSLSIKVTPQACYMNAVLSLYKLNDPQLCWHYLSLMYERTPFKNYVRSASLSGRSLLMLNKNEKALLFLIQSCRNFPLSCANWNCRALTLDALGRHQEAMNAYCIIHEILKRKNLSEHDLPLLLKNPLWDVNAHKIPPELLYRNRNKK